MTLAEHMAKLRAEIKSATNLNPRIWEHADLHRIYFQTGSSEVRAFITFDPDNEPDPNDLFAGCALKVWSDLPTGNAKWNVDNSKRHKHALMWALTTAAKSGGITSPALAAVNVPERWQDVRQ